MRRINCRKHAIYSAVVGQAGIVGIHGRCSVDGSLELSGLVLLHKIIGGIEIGMHFIRFYGESLLVFAFGGILFLGHLGIVEGPREMSLDRIDRSDRFHLGFGFVLVPADDPWRVNIKFFEIAASGNVRWVRGDGIFKFLFHLFREEKTVFSIGLSAVRAAEPQMVIGIFGIVLDG